MKRIWFGAALMLFLLILGIGSSTLLERTQPIQAGRLEQAAVLATEGNWAAAREFMEAAKQEWERSRPWLAALCTHEEMDHLEGLFAQLEVFSENRSGVSFSSTCVYLALQLESMAGSHSLTIENLF